MSRVFVGNLSFRTTDQDLEEAFIQFGAIQRATVITRGRRSLGYGFVDFASPENAESALSKNLSDLFGRQIKVELAKTEEEKSIRRPPAVESLVNPLDTVPVSQDQPSLVRPKRRRFRPRKNNQNQPLNSEPLDRNGDQGSEHGQSSNPGPNQMTNRPVRPRPNRFSRKRNQNQNQNQNPNPNPNQNQIPDLNQEQNQNQSNDFNQEQPAG
eukprot:TRINITY_DN791_c0_g3_i2.p1 TRINITY_DN791_c0_g3~~TRINITY_DN791_c0_g3_i2.p1  ORF type:complete len:211 (+),score=25.76 TRINITY_DN791_c0_g3_i2:330-962(+)